MNSATILTAIITTLGGVVVGVLGVLGGRRLSRSQAGSFDAQAAKTLAEAEDMRLGTATRAADYIGTLSTSYRSLERDHARMERRLDAFQNYAREHGRWDERVISMLQQVAETLKAAGLTNDDLLDPGQPPPLIPHGESDDRADSGAHTHGSSGDRRS